MPLQVKSSTFGSNMYRRGNRVLTANKKMALKTKSMPKINASAVDSQSTFTTKNMTN